MSEILKPCPFCGGKAMFLTIANKSSHSAVGVMFKIKCTKCGTELPKSYECEMYMDQDGGIRTGKDERTKAITDWTGGRVIGRLIDAGLVLDNLSGRLESMKDYDAVKDVINNMPTAYDPDKVLNQLEDYSNVNEAEMLGTIPVIELDDAIEIVKGGGVDGN